jgi:Fe-S-cluster containining protein
MRYGIEYKIGNRGIRMNKSCEKCGGACCEFFGLKSDVDDPEWLMARSTKKVPYGEYDVVIFDYPCKWLKEGKCDIYDVRPQVCQDLEVGSSGCRFALSYRGRMVGNVLAQEQEDEADDQSHYETPPSTV